MVDRVMCESKRKGKEKETETGKRGLGPPGRPELLGMEVGRGSHKHVCSPVSVPYGHSRKETKTESLGKALLGAQ